MYFSSTTETLYYMKYIIVKQNQSSFAFSVNFKSNESIVLEGNLSIR